MYVVDVRKNITVDSSSLEITNFIEMRVEATRSPAKPKSNGDGNSFVQNFGRIVVRVVNLLSPAITAWVYFFGNMLANP